MKFKEVEFKYRADDISLSKFSTFCQTRTPLEVLEASGFDHFYESTQSEGSFCRHRVGPDCNQLTFKRKTDDVNNYVRTEHNLDLTKKMKNDQVEALCAEFGYKHNFSLFKNCFIYVYDYYTLVYYICYDADMKELGRFVEIEMKEDHGWENETHAWDELVTLERLCRPLGISAQQRTKKSLFEMYKK